MSGDGDFLIEVIGADGDQPADRPEQAERPEPPSSGSSTGRWAVGVVGAVVIVGILLATIGGDNDEPPPPAEPLGVVSGPDIDLRTGVRDARFPLFGRVWDGGLVATDGAAIVHLDLNTGELSTVTRLPSDSSPVQGIAVIDDEILVRTIAESYAVADGAALERASYTEPIPAVWPETAGQYWYTLDGFARDQMLQNWVSTESIELTEPIDFVAAGADVYTQHGGLIAHVTPTSAATRWADGEILAVGPNHVVWRECEAVDDCSYWSGTADDPREIPLDAAATVRAMLGNTIYRDDRTVTGVDELVSPSGRYAWTVEPDADSIAAVVQLADLASSDSVAIRGTGLFPWIADDDRMVIAGRRGRQIAIDTATGTAVRLPIAVRPPFALDPEGIAASGTATVE